ncbi:iron-containing alcohol dehydrogenase family protein [Orrella sp. 11846]|uniref:iron-containing alcohol dehydrogenase family protein n=1 Tax=Orrella sp. 11846 TaxID=3409913 RepID=UPI003B5A8642
MPNSVSFAWPGDCIAGSSAVQTAGALLHKNAKVLVVTDSNVWPIAKETVEQILSVSGAKIAATFDQIQANPDLEITRKIEKIAQEIACDVIIAVGGGSVIDAAKLAHASMISDKNCETLLLEGCTTTDTPSQSNDPRFIAIPTTSGTGSESSTGALIKDDSGRKLMFRSRRSRPSVVVLLPQLTLEVPQSVTAATGLDAILHAFGALVNNDAALPGDAIAAQALRMGFEAYPDVLKHPESLSARTQMMWASYLAGVAIGIKKVDGVHGLCTPLEGYCKLPHAGVLTVIFRTVTQYSLEEATPQYARAARLCGLSNHETSDREAAHLLLEKIEQMIKLSGLPIELKHSDLDHEKLQKALDQTDNNKKEACENFYTDLAQHALKSISTKLNPRPLTAESIAAIYKKVLPQSLLTNQ